MKTKKFLVVSKPIFQAKNKIGDIEKKNSQRDYSTGNFYVFFNNSDPNLTQTQILTLKLTLNLILTQTLSQTLILILEKSK